MPLLDDDVSYMSLHLGLSSPEPSALASHFPRLQAKLILSFVNIFFLI